MRSSRAATGSSGHSARASPPSRRESPFPRSPAGCSGAPGTGCWSIARTSAAPWPAPPRAELLGTICREDTRLLDVIPDYGSNVVTCEGQGGATFWRLPTGPLTGQLAGRIGVPVRVRDHGHLAGRQAPDPRAGPQDRLDPAAARRHLAVAIGQDGNPPGRDSLGEVGVIDLGAGYARQVVVGKSPDNSPVTAVGWSDGPVATTRWARPGRLPIAATAPPRPALSARTGRGSWAASPLGSSSSSAAASGRLSASGNARRRWGGPVAGWVVTTHHIFISYRRPDGAWVRGLAGGRSRPPRRGD